VVILRASSCYPFRMTGTTWRQFEYGQPTLLQDCLGSLVKSFEGINTLSLAWIFHPRTQISAHLGTMMLLSSFGMLNRKYAYINFDHKWADRSRNLRQTGYPRQASPSSSSSFDWTTANLSWVLLDDRCCQAGHETRAPAPFQSRNKSPAFCSKDETMLSYPSPCMYLSH
jgi:hypothetical protein